MKLILFILAVACVASLIKLMLLKRRIRKISEAAGRLAEGKIEKMPPMPKGELKSLALTLNLLSDRFEHDVSELKRLEEVRKEFVANVSHELRTPLASIKAFAETLLDGAMEDVGHRGEFIREIFGSAERMGNLIEDILEISALESGKMPPNFEHLSLIKSVSSAVAELTPLAEQKGIVLRVEPFGDIPDVRADKNKLHRVFINLIDNAIKYTPENGLIRVSALRDGSWVSVFIEDNGIGIPKADLPRIFERFYRADKARSRELGGTGLGLSIVKHIVELHGGAAGVQSELGRGSKFFFRLPAVK